MKQNIISDSIATYLIGIDVGTTSIKGVLITGTGVLVTSVGKEYSLEYGPDETCELDPEVYWNITCKVIREMIQMSGIDAALVSGVAFSSQGETIIAVDYEGKPLRKAIIWLDNRSVKEAKRIEEKFGNQQILDITGQPEVLATWPATRILWLLENEPHIFNKVGKFLLVEDFLLFRMTGKYCAEHSLASSTLYFNILQKVWWKEMLDFLQISERQLPQLYESGMPIRNLTEEASSLTGLTTKTKVVSGAYDHPSGAIGAGNIAEGMVTLTIGASMAMCVTLNKPVIDITLKLPCQCHVIPGMYFLLPYAQTAGLVLKWFKEEFCREEIEIAGKLNSDPYNILIAKAEQIPPGAEGLIVLPHFMGTGSPEFNNKVKGVFAGVTPRMTKGHFIRSILEAVVCSVELNLETMKQKGIKINEIHSLGGGAKSHLWNQILADMTGIPIVTMSQTENAAIGAAMLAGVGTGVFSNIEKGCETCIKEHLRFEPDQGNFEVYRKIYRKYLMLYKCMENYW
ncbi:MAG: FGGY family carbohydrate kinase [Bacteroidales bacterium]